MPETTTPENYHGTWSSRLTFILAATGSAVGLGNIWKFPYIAGENGGGAFVLVYLACILIVGTPVMIAEVLMGRRGRSSPIHSVIKLAKEAGVGQGWQFIGWMGVLAGLIILSYYSVVAGWVLAYLPKMASGTFTGIDGAGASTVFSTLLADPWALLRWHTVFIVMSILVVVAGVKKGLGNAVRILMPLLFLLLLVLLVFGVLKGDFPAAVKSLFSVDFSSLSGHAVLEALGHAFFTLSLGMGAIMAYGSYMPADMPVGRSVITIAFLDTLVALVAGLAIFPIVFASPGIEPGSGPGLLFVSLPVAFGGIALGGLFGTLFFTLVGLAAWSSAISLVEPGIAWMVERMRITRLKAGVIVGLICWSAGIGSLLSFNLWDDLKLFGKFTWFDFSDFLTANVMLPLGGALIAIFVGHIMSKDVVRSELGAANETTYKVWRFLVCWVSPLLVATIFVAGLRDVFSG